MARFTLLLSIAVALLLADSRKAEAEVVVVEPRDSSAPMVVRTKPPTTVVVVNKNGSVPPPQAAPPKPRDRKVGLHFDVAGTLGPQVTMGGFNGALRFRPKEHVGIDLGSGYFVGDDFQGFHRSEIPVTTNLLLFVNPQHKLQVYFLLGPGMSIGRVDTFDETRRMIYVGGQAGLGLELRLARAFALNFDARGVLRHRVDRDARPEFVDGTRATDTSGGALLTFGATFYF